MERLYLHNNRLTGPLPSSFVQLDRLDRFRIAENESLCVPGIQAFATWIEEIEDRDNTPVSCNADDVLALTLLFEVAGGRDWKNSDGWLNGFAVDGWHGVSADSLGRVTMLDLSGNELAGRLPASISALARLTELKIANNPTLAGRLPLSLADLPLRALSYAKTALCVPDSASFQRWLSAIPSHDGTGAECPPLSDREALEALYDATGGRDWTHNENWITDAPLAEWRGIEVDTHGNVIYLQLAGNNLAGAIPPELGSLANLRSLQLGSNNLTGAIPPELGRLAELERLYLYSNSLTGPIPPELGGLASLEALVLSANGLTGAIPPELGRLTKLEWLELHRNNLTGTVPPELGALADLEWLYLGENGLEGGIPPELGDLANLERLWLGENDLFGPIPHEIGGLANLEWLWLSGNDLSGPIPPEVGNLVNLKKLSLNSNRLTGPVPPEFGSLDSLTELGLSGNTGCQGLCQQR